MDRAVVAEGRHGAPQAICLVGREFGGLDGDLHRLFLEQRHALAFFSGHSQLISRAMRRIGRRIMLRLDAIAPAQIGMHHVALNRAWPHDRHFDDEIVEFSRLEARQHRHLRPALDLEHAHGIGTRQHLVDCRVLLRQGRERVVLVVVDFQKIEARA